MYAVFEVSIIYFNKFWRSFKNSYQFCFLDEEAIMFSDK